jgi:hypothetical protein
MVDQAILRLSETGIIARDDVTRAIHAARDAIASAFGALGRVPPDAPAQGARWSVGTACRISAAAQGVVPGLLPGDENADCTISMLLTSQFAYVAIPARGGKHPARQVAIPTPYLIPA